MWFLITLVCFIGFGSCVGLGFANFEIGEFGRGGKWLLGAFGFGMLLVVLLGARSEGVMF